MPGPDTKLNRACRKVGAVTEVLPQSWSRKARGELNEACCEIAAKAEALSAGPAKDPYPKDSLKPDKLTDFTNGSGERLKLGVPVKLSSGTDIYLFLNYDKKRLLRGDPTLNGGEAGFRAADRGSYHAQRRGVDRHQEGTDLQGRLHQARGGLLTGRRPVHQHSGIFEGA